MKSKNIVASMLLIMLLTSGVFAVSNTDAKRNSGDSSRTFLSSVNGTENSYTEISNSQPVDVNEISVSLDPRKQTSASNSAFYKVTVKAHYLPQTDSLESEDYELFFEPENRYIEGEFSKKSVTLVPGQKATVDLEISAETSGDHTFFVTVKGQNEKEATAKGLLTVLDSNTQASQKIKLDLQPEKQYTETGTSEFVLIVSRPAQANCISDKNCAASYSAQEYDLVFSSEQESVVGEFLSANPIALNPGERISVPLTITAKEKGTYVFKVYAKTSDYETGVKGLLVYGKEPQEINPPKATSSSSSLLNGKGFATNEDQSEGVLVYLNLLGENEIRGKLVFGKEDYALKGKTFESDNKIQFELYNAQDGVFDKSVGDFEGEIKKFDGFSVLKGSLDFKNEPYPNQYWTMNIIGERDRVFDNEIIAEKDIPVTKTINKEEVVTIRQTLKQSEPAQEHTSEAYIVPEKIEKEKIFGLIPNPWGDRILKVKLVDGEKITQEVVKEFGSNRIGDYEVSIGSLEDENSIEVSIKKSGSIKLN